MSADPLAGFPRPIERKTGGEEGSVVVGELDIELGFDVSELRIGETWPELVDLFLAELPRDVRS